ncbi:MAG TPA: hypothetical protein VJ801_17005 [Polyangia bacterium]|jgi:hypothetical protein|nr:hypothetical protein [Polyangia bacterium]
MPPACRIPRLVGEKSKATVTNVVPPPIVLGNSQPRTRFVTHFSTRALPRVDEANSEDETAPVTDTVKCTVTRPFSSGILVKAFT